MTFLMIFFVILGVFAAQLSLLPAFFITYSSYITDFALCLLLVVVGFDIGKNKDAVLKLIKKEKFAFLVPVGTVIGTIAGGLISSFFIPLSTKNCIAISAGFGWYSLSAVIITDLTSADMGSIAFLANVIREILSILLIPVIAKKIGPYESIAPGGATTMDTTLPIIKKYAGENAAVVAFVHGFILSALVPFIVPLLLG
jgi:uncharacterized membrane protein YbjE (DUF340 family)